MTKDKRITYEDYQKGRFVGEGVGAPEFKLNIAKPDPIQNNFLH
ncbi:MAG: hypothetical protein QS98_C0003G0019 [archaeon GW2011_AR3]|nr:MAG: hypothetical protein QS98_C0003G0019 [archaeon GW2011_AR3]